MNGCIYRTKDGECDLYAEGGKYTAFCEMENCKGRKMSNADRIRAMSDEELAVFLLEATSNAIVVLGIGSNGKSKNAFDWYEWLKSPADKDGAE